jgi:hypothetical protein
VNASRRFRDRFREAGWLDEVLLWEEVTAVGPGARLTRRVWCVKAGIPLIAFGLLGFVVCMVWALVEAVVT